MQIVITILSTISAVASAIAAIITYINGKRMANGNVELQIRTMISEAKYHQNECMIKLADDPKNETLKSVYDMLTEEVLNAYDEACAKYNDKKVDRERFKKMYLHEIRQLVEYPEFKEKYDSISSRYNATKKVYNEWNHMEYWLRRKYYEKANEKSSVRCFVDFDGF